MARLFSYVVRWDDGAAPNPFWDLCSLVICKPVIRRTAAKEDWILGTGGKNSDCGDTTGRVIYAMRITEEVLTHASYDEFCRRHLPKKIPDWNSSDLRRKYGDCIYDFSTSPPTLRPSCHDSGNVKKDMAGRCALLSKEFYYFGKNSVPLPASLTPVVKSGQGHKVDFNELYKEEFIRWIRTQRPGVNGDPQMWGDKNIGSCGSCRAADDAEDLAASPGDGC
jgi:hypothetical protein